ncbi:MAG: YHS domain-containing (seleno)protein [Bosea sp. (in: a-proteobacteria)]
MNKISLAMIAVVSSMLFTGAANAYDITSKAAINVSSTKIALQSHDPVAYFTVGKPVLGSDAFSAEYEGATYRFSSDANRKAFLADPVKYAPLHGGFCQMGTANGRKLDGDPNLFRVANGRLAVFSYPAALEGFKKDPEGNAKKAEANWATIKEKTPRELFGF